MITGPSGVGKGTLIRALRELVPELELSTSATTRSPRAGEERRESTTTSSSVDEFARRVEAGEFIEHATYSGNRYGTLRSEVEERNERGAPVVLEIELQGARQVRAQHARGGPDLHRAARSGRPAQAPGGPRHR